MVAKQMFVIVASHAKAEFDRITDDDEREDYLHQLETKLSRFVWQHISDQKGVSGKRVCHNQRLAYKASKTLFLLVNKAYRMNPENTRLRVYRSNVYRTMTDNFIKYTKAIAGMGGYLAKAIWLLDRYRFEKIASLI